jgi:hypothetical protein
MAKETGNGLEPDGKQKNPQKAEAGTDWESKR